MIKPIKVSPIKFGYKSILKTLFKEGKLPSVQVDIYGKPIKPDMKDLTIEHIIPRVKGGKSKLVNYALANYADNQKRSAGDLLSFTTIENIKNWYNQFKGVILPNFNGYEYIKEGIKNLKKINIVI